MRALLPLLGLVVFDAERPDTKTAIRDVVEKVAELAEDEDFDAGRTRLVEFEAALGAVSERTWSARFKGDPPASLEERALVTHARGVLEMQAGELLAAASFLEQARAQAGPGVIRLDSTYDLGVMYLEEGERHRAQIPEFSGGAPAPAPLPGGAEEAPDPLESARANYLKARDWFVERLILDWRDADTRANVELTQRRLRELDELERQRQEQEDQEQQEPKDGQEPQEGDEEGEESSDDEQDPGEDSEENAEGEREPQEPGEGEDPPEEEPQTDEDDEADPQEIHLTQEEMQRLLDALREIEEEGAEVQDALRRIGRQDVARDW